MFPLLLIALAVGGFLFVRQAQSEGPTLTTQPVLVAAATDFAAAQPVLEAWFATHGTYAGVRLQPAYAVAVARADASSFCLQTGTRSGAMHEIGPGGAPQSGPC